MHYNFQYTLGTYIMNQNDKIVAIMHKLHSKYPVLTLNAGIGYCVYGSKLLTMELDKVGISSDILVGKVLSNTAQGKKAKQAASVVIMDIVLTEDANDPSSNIKRSYIKRGKHLLTNTGHAVVLIKSTVYDITAAQFSNPEVYSLAMFESTWIKTTFANVTIDTSKDFGIGELQERSRTSRTFATAW